MNEPLSVKWFVMQKVQKKERGICFKERKIKELTMKLMIEKNILLQWQNIIMKKTFNEAISGSPGK